MKWHTMRRRSMKRPGRAARVSASMGLMCGLCMLSTSAANAEALESDAFSATVVAPQAVATKTDRRWRGAINGGGTLISGDTHSFSLIGDAEAQWATSFQTLSASLMGVRGTTRDKKGVSTQSANYLRGLLQYDHNLSERVYALTYLEMERAPLRDLSLRVATGLGAGYHVIRQERTHFDVFAGLGYNWERYSASTSDSGVKTGAEILSAPELMFGEKWRHQFTRATSIEQRFALFPSIDPGGRIRTQFDISLITALSERLQLKVSLLNIYRSHPARSNKSFNTMLMTTIGYTFGRS